jgi:hypothetical protein
VEISGYVVLGIVTLLFVYLMPQLIRGRQDAVDARVDDRFSADLRILATSGTAGSPARPAPDDDVPRAYLHDPRLRTGVAPMNRPPAPTVRAVTSGAPAAGDAAPRSAAPAGDAARAERERAEARAAAARRRRAAARRRLVLTLALLTLTAGAWAAVVLGHAQPGGAVIPSALLLLVLVLGRRAARAGRRIARAEAARAHQATAGPTARPGAEPHAGPARPSAGHGAGAPAARSVPTVPPSREATTEIIPAAASVPSGLRWRGEPTTAEVREVGEGVIVTSPEPAGGRGGANPWTPVPVPVPTYTLKPAAPRVDTAPLVVDGPAAEADAPAPAEPPARGVDLDAVLERRRAAGE